MQGKRKVCSQSGSRGIEEVDEEESGEKLAARQEWDWGG